MKSTLRTFPISARAVLVLGVLALFGIFVAISRWTPVTHGQEREFNQEREEISPEATVTPAILLQYASIVSAGNTITITRAPVTTSTGATVYEDITLQLGVAANGAITMVSGYPKWNLSPVLTVAAFKPGIYVGPENVDGGKMGFALSGPQPGAGVTVWSIATAPNYYAYTTPGNATFYVGPLASNLEYPRLKKAGITNTSLSYGFLGSGDANNGWCKGDLLGFSQVANTITVENFTGCGNDQPTPVDQYTYTAK